MEEYKHHDTKHAYIRKKLSGNAALVLCRSGNSGDYMPFVFENEINYWNGRNHLYKSIQNIQMPRMYTGIRLDIARTLEQEIDALNKNKPLELHKHLHSKENILQDLDALLIRD